MPDFKIASSEFNRQANILEALVATIDISAHQDGLTKHAVAGDELPILPTGSQNTMAAAAIVLLAAHFEEYVRQQIEEYAKAMVTEYMHLTDAVRERLIDTYWRAAWGRLARIRPRSDPLWTSAAEPLLRALIGYPIEGDVGRFQAAVVCDHENNMRWETILELTGRVGIRKLSDLMFRSARLKTNLGSPSRGDFVMKLGQKLNEFQATRNGIVHSIAQISGIGATVFREWTEFFRVLTIAFSDAIEEGFRLFSSDVAKRKAAA